MNTVTQRSMVVAFRHTNHIKDTIMQMMYRGLAVLLLLEDALLEWEWHLGMTTVVDGSVGHAVFDPESL